MGIALRLDQADQRLAELTARRAMGQAARGRRPRRRRKVVKQNFPRGVRLRYQRALLAIVRAIAEQIRVEILPLVQRLAAQTRQLDPSTRQDAPADTVIDSLSALQKRLTTTPSAITGIQVTARTAVTDTVAFNARELNRVFSSSLGVGLPAVEPFLDDFIVTAVRENVRRISSLAGSEFAEAEQTILSGFRRGSRFEEIAARIEGRFDIVENRARLIARDQIASLNGELNRLRQTNMGVESYIWRTSGDDDVRASHEELDGERFTWATGSSEGHPGEPIVCRCIAEPILGDLIEATDPAFI